MIRRLFDDIERLWRTGEPEPSEGAVARMFVPAIDDSRRGDKLVGGERDNPGQKSSISDDDLGRPSAPPPTDL